MYVPVNRRKLPEVSLCCRATVNSCPSNMTHLLFHFRRQNRYQLPRKLRKPRKGRG